MTQSALPFFMRTNLSAKVLSLLVAGFTAIWFFLLPSMLQDPQLFMKDAGSYSQTATHLAQEYIYTETGEPYFEREPGYAFFLSVLYRLLGVENRIGIFAVQAIIYVCCVLIFIREFRKRSEGAAMITAGFLLLSPSIHRTIFSVLRENLTLCLFLLVLAILMSFVRNQTFWKAVGIGVVLGIISLTYYSFVFLPCFVIAYLPLKKCSWRFLLMIGVIPYLMLSFWGLRNYRVVGEFRVIGSERALATWYGRAEQAKVLRGTEPIRCLYAKYISQNWSDLPRQCSMDTLRHEYIDRVAKGDVMDPVSVLQENFPAYLWESLINAADYQLPYVGFWGSSYNILASVEMLLLGIGCVFSLRKWRSVDLFLLVWVYGTAFFALNEVVQRFHMPVMVVYAAMSGIGYAELIRVCYDRFHEKRFIAAARGITGA